MTDYKRRGIYHKTGIAVETVAGTWVTPTVFLSSYTTDMDSGIKDTILDEQRGRRNPFNITLRDGAEPKGTIAGPFRPEFGAEQLTYAMLGQKTSAKQGATAAYLHTLSPSSTIQTLPSLSITEWGVDGVYAWPGYYVNSGKFEINDKGTIKTSYDLLGAPPDLSKSAPTATWATAQPLQYRQTVFKLNTVELETATKFSMEYSNNIDSIDTLNQLYHPDYVMGEITCKGRLEFEKLNMEEFNEYLSGSISGIAISDTINDHQLDIEVTGGLIESPYYYYLHIHIPKVNFIPLTDDKKYGKDVSVYGMDWQAKDDVTNETVKIEIMSKLTAIT